MKTFTLPLSKFYKNEQLIELLNANVDQIKGALEFPEQDGNDRILIDDVTFKSIKSIQTRALEINYEYQWSFFAGCRDISKTGINQGVVNAHHDDDFLVFDIIEYPEPRTTLDEF